jgi:peptide deformylase
MRAIVTVPNPCLRLPCKRVEVVDSYIIALARELAELLDYINTPVLRAYGLSAPQVGECVQLFVIATFAVKMVVLNPIVVKTFGIHSWVEGCLSLPNRFYMVRRPKLIKFQYLDLAGGTIRGLLRDDYAGVCQHEIQHLSGIMIDAIGSPIKREAIFRR